MTTKTKKPVKRLTKAQRRVAIAKDVLKHLRTMRIAAGQYLHGYIESGIDNGEDAQARLPEIRKKCNVCAMGACLLGHIGAFDRLKMNSMFTSYGSPLVDREEIVEILKNSFQKSDLLLIEAAFEKTYYSWTLDVLSKEKILAAVRFGRKNGPPRKRLKAIMRNIVKNNGDFIPE